MIAYLAFAVLFAAPVEQKDPLDAELRAVLQKFGGDAAGLPATFRDDVRRYRDELLGRKDLAAILERKDRYWPVIARELSAKSLPEEFGFVALAESHFDPLARSEISAGVWQFTAPTARKFGLRVEEAADDRLDVEKSSHAAAAYLSALVGEFGPESFMLALASYNAGEQTVRRGLEQVAHTRGGLRNAAHDFWDLYRMKLLGEEARQYVPKVIAAAIVAGRSRTP